MDSIANFCDNGRTDFDSTVKMQRQDVKWRIVAIAANGIIMVLFSTQRMGECMGDALKGHKKDVTKFSFFINSAGSCTFNSTWPDFTLKKMSKVAPYAAAPSGRYEGRVPLIVDSIANFHDNGTMDFDNNVKFQRQDAKWQRVAIVINGITVEFPNT